MCRWICWINAVVPSDAVARRHYFMEFMQLPAVIWMIRIACVVMAIAVFVLYRNMKRNSGA